MLSLFLYNKIIFLLFIFKYAIFSSTWMVNNLLFIVFSLLFIAWLSSIINACDYYKISISFTALYSTCFDLFYLFNTNFISITSNCSYFYYDFFHLDKIYWGINLLKSIEIMWKSLGNFTIVKGVLNIMKRRKQSLCTLKFEVL